MAYVLVTADFPGVDARQKAEIYRGLRKKWQQTREPASGVTVWFAPFKNTFSKTDFIKNVINDFVACAPPYCNPRLALQLSTTKPAAVSNLR